METKTKPERGLSALTENKFTEDSGESVKGLKIRSYQQIHLAVYVRNLQNYRKWVVKKLVREADFEGCNFSVDGDFRQERPYLGEVILTATGLKHADNHSLTKKVSSEPEEFRKINMSHLSAKEFLERKGMNPHDFVQSFIKVRYRGDPGENPLRGAELYLAEVAIDNGYSGIVEMDYKNHNFSKRTITIEAKVLKSR